MFFVEKEKAGGNWFKSFDTVDSDKLENQNATLIPGPLIGVLDENNLKRRT
jgi:hypothetical protein